MKNEPTRRLRERAEVADCMRRLYERGLTTTSGGNISLRLEDGHVLFTPSKLDKSRLQAGDIGVLSPQGRNLTPALEPTVEMGMHLGVYRARPEVRAVIHAHAPLVTAFSATGRRIDTRLASEAYAILGRPGWVDYEPFGSEALARAVAAAVAVPGRNCLVLANHGALAVGRSLLEAFDRIEVLEAAARITLWVRFLGCARPLEMARLAELDILMGRPPLGAGPSPDSIERRRDGPPPEEAGDR